MIIANWKMNGSKELIEFWIEFLSDNLIIDEERECIFCPPTSYLDFTGSLIKERCKGIKLGSQQLNSDLLTPFLGGVMNIYT